MHLQGLSDLFYVHTLGWEESHCRRTYFPSINSKIYKSNTIADVYIVNFYSGESDGSNPMSMWVWYLQPKWWWLSWNLCVQTVLIYNKVTIYAGISPDLKLLWLWIWTLCFKFYISYNHLHFVNTAPQKSLGWFCLLPFFWKMLRLG